MTPEALLYTLTLHGQGWHVEQRPDTDAEDGWVLARELSSTSALAEADRESAELMVSSMTSAAPLQITCGAQGGFWLQGDFCRIRTPCSRVVIL